ncbi:MAG: hypothetical protein WAO46_01270, partial [Tepidanaerobacteraceae bacterium]
PEAKSRSDEQEPDKRLTWGGRVCITKQSPTLHKPHTVNLADIRDEGYRSYPGRSDGYTVKRMNFLYSNLHRDM